MSHRLLSVDELLVMLQNAVTIESWLDCIMVDIPLTKWNSLYCKDQLLEKILQPLAVECGVKKVCFNISLED